MPLNLVHNDITRMKVDAIVNAANNSLLGGGGVDGAIHRAAGPKLLEECRGLHGCDTGSAKITRGYNLPCKYVIHTVGPIWRGGRRGEPELLASCYRNSLRLAKEYGCESVAFPLISAGVYGYPKAEALQIAIREIAAFLADNDMTVYMVLFTRDAMEVTGKLFGAVNARIADVYAEAPCDAPPDPDRMPAQTDEGFQAMLLRRIDEKHMTDAECCKRANLDRRLFNKIKNTPGCRPGKQTVLAFAVALRLSLEETRELLSRAGFSLTHSSKSDIVVEYCIMNNIYDIFEINQVLFKLDLQPLGY